MVGKENVLEQSWWLHLSHYIKPPSYPREEGGREASLALPSHPSPCLHPAITFFLCEIFSSPSHYLLSFHCSHYFPIWLWLVSGCLTSPSFSTSPSLPPSISVCPFLPPLMFLSPLARNFSIWSLTSAFSFVSLVPTYRRLPKTYLSKTYI